MNRARDQTRMAPGIFTPPAAPDVKAPDSSDPLAPGLGGPSPSDLLAMHVNVALYPAGPVSVHPSCTARDARRSLEDPTQACAASVPYPNTSSSRARQPFCAPARREAVLRHQKSTANCFCKAHTRVVTCVLWPASLAPLRPSPGSLQPSASLVTARCIHQAACC